MYILYLIAPLCLNTCFLIGSHLEITKILAIPMFKSIALEKNSHRFFV